MVQKTSTQPEENPVGILGKAVRDFMAHHEIKSLYVRAASHLGSTQFVEFKKAN